MSKPTPSSTEKLRKAVAEEKRASDASRARYHALTAKITDYQLGKGPAPESAEFTQWLADVQRAVDLKAKLGAG